MQKQKKDRIVITGLGIVANTGFGKEDFYTQLKEGLRNPDCKKEWSESELEHEYYFDTPEIKIKDHFKKLKAPYPLKYSQLAMMGCKHAIEDAGLPEAEIPDDRVGIILNTSFAANAAVEDYLEKLFTLGPRKASPFKFTKTVSNTALGYVTRAFTYRGPSSLLLGENSVTYGYDALKNDTADVMICGGFDEMRDVLFLSYAHHNHLLPTGAAGEEDYVEQIEKYLDEQRIVFGQASAFVVLEKMDKAEARGAKIYAEILDYSTGLDQTCEHFVFERNESDFTRVIEDSLDRSHLSSDKIDCIVGASCLPNQFNAYEGKAIKELWDGNPIHYTTIKPSIGETFGASGQASLIAAALMLNNDEVVGTGLPNSYFKARMADTTIPQHTVSKELNHVMVNSIHSGGNTTSLILKKIE